MLVEITLTSIDFAVNQIDPKWPVKNQENAAKGNINCEAQDKMVLNADAIESKVMCRKVL